MMSKAIAIILCYVRLVVHISLILVLCLAMVKGHLLIGFSLISMVLRRAFVCKESLAPQAHSARGAFRIILDFRFTIDLMCH